MNFLSPQLLWFLPLVLLPLLFTWFRNRQAPESEYSSLYWLGEEIKNRFKRKQSRRWLTALWRVLLLLLLVYLLAQPLLGGLSQSPEKLVLIVDNSHSMQQEHVGQSALARTKDWIKTELAPGLAPESIKLGVLKPRLTWLGEYSSFEKLPLDKIEFSSGEAGLETTFQRLTGQSIDDRAQIVILSDAQEKLFRKLKKRADRPRVELATPFPEPENHTLLAGGVREGSLYLDQEGTIFWRTRPENTRPQRIVFDDEQEMIPGPTTARLNWQADREGIHRGQIKLAPDDLNWDNRWYFTVPVQERLKVHFIGESPAISSLKFALQKQIEPVKSVLAAQLVIVGDDNFGEAAQKKLQLAKRNDCPRLLLLDAKLDRAELESLLSGLEFPWLVEGKLTATEKPPVKLEEPDWFAAPEKLPADLVDRLQLTEFYQLSSRHQPRPIITAGDNTLLAAKDNWLIFGLPPEPYLQPDRATVGWATLLKQIVFTAARNPGLPAWTTGQKAEFPGSLQFPVAITTPEDGQLTLEEKQDFFVPETAGFYKLSGSQNNKYTVAANRNRDEANLTRRPPEQWPEYLQVYAGPSDDYSYPLALPLWLLLSLGFATDLLFFS